MTLIDAIFTAIVAVAVVVVVALLTSEDINLNTSFQSYGVKFGLVVKRLMRRNRNHGEPQVHGVVERAAVAQGISESCALQKDHPTDDG